LTGELSAEDFDCLKATDAEDTANIEQQLTALESEKNMMQELIEESRVSWLTWWVHGKKSGSAAGESFKLHYFQKVWCGATQVAF